MERTDEQALDYLVSIVKRRIEIDERLAEMGKPTSRRDKRLFFKPLIKERNFLSKTAQSYVPTLLESGFARKNIAEVITRSTNLPAPKTGQLMTV